MSDDLGDPVPTPEQYAAIGRVVANWANVEGLVQLMFVQLMGLEDESGRLIAARIRRHRLLFPILEERAKRVFGKEHLAALIERRDAISDLSDERDEIVHRSWFKDLSDPSRLEGEWETRFKQMPVAYKTADEINDLARRISAESARLVLFFADIIRDPDVPLLRDPQ